MAPNVFDGDFDVEITKVALGLTGGWVVDVAACLVEGDGTVFGRPEIVQCYCCITARDVVGVLGFSVASCFEARG